MGLYIGIPIQARNNVGCGLVTSFFPRVNLYLSSIKLTLQASGLLLSEYTALQGVMQVNLGVKSSWGGFMMYVQH